MCQQKTYIDKNKKASKNPLNNIKIKRKTYILSLVFIYNTLHE